MELVHVIYFVAGLLLGLSLVAMQHARLVNARQACNEWKTYAQELKVQLGWRDSFLVTRLATRAFDLERSRAVTRYDLPHHRPLSSRPPPLSEPPVESGMRALKADAREARERYDQDHCETRVIPPRRRE